MQSRLIYTIFWKDEYISELSIEEKLLFLYYLTNERVNIIHCYEITEREIVFDTGIDRGILGGIRSKFEADGKMFFFKNWVLLANAARYEKYKGEKNDNARQKIVNRMPNDVYDWYTAILDRGIHRGIDRVYKSEIINHKSEIIDHKSEIRDMDSLKKSLSSKLSFKN